MLDINSINNDYEDEPKIRVDANGTLKLRYCTQVLKTKCRMAVRGLDANVIIFQMTRMQIAKSRTRGNVVSAPLLRSFPIFSWMETV